MYAMKILFCLLMMSAYCADMLKPLPQSWMIGPYSEHFNWSRVYQYRDAQNEERRINVAYNTQSTYRIKSGTAGEFVVRDQEKKRRLSILMEFGQDPYEVLRTTVGYEAHQRVEEVVVSSCVSRGSNDGYITVSAPFSKPYSQCTPVRPAELTLFNRPQEYGLITADEKGVSVTRYIFRSPRMFTGVFVRMCVQYETLYDVNTTWGTETYAGCKCKGEEVDTCVAGELPFQFSASIREGTGVFLIDDDCDDDFFYQSENIRWQEASFFADQNDD